MDTVIYKTDLAGVDWAEMKDTLERDDFDNGRSVEQYQASFEHSYACCIAYVDGRIVGTVRALSDGICNAYIVDVWTLSRYRHRGIASSMMQHVLDKLPGQHVYLFTDDMSAFYKQLGFSEQPIGMSKVVGSWLVNS